MKKVEHIYAYVEVNKITGDEQIYFIGESELLAVTDDKRSLEYIEDLVFKDLMKYKEKDHVEIKLVRFIKEDQLPISL
jgi:hypothetical protein